MSHFARIPAVPRIDAPLGDWWFSCPLTCDTCHYQTCTLPTTKEKVLRSIGNGTKASFDELDTWLEERGLAMFITLDEEWERIWQLICSEMKSKTAIIKHLHDELG